MDGIMNGMEMQELLRRKWEEGMAWEAFVAASSVNVDAMRANYDATMIAPEINARLKSLGSPVHLLALAADWCGDAVANVPSAARLAALNPGVLELRLLDRDANDDLMRHFLTNGGKAIPKIIVAPPGFSHHESWGPRPAPCQAIMDGNKATMPKEEIYPLIRAWYVNDRNQTLISELTAAIERQAGR